MNISELIIRLQELKDIYGDVEVVIYDHEYSDVESIEEVYGRPLYDSGNEVVIK
jgi:hypothetical protein